MTPEPTEAELAVLDTALAEELGVSSPPDLWPRLRPRRRWSLLAAAIVLASALVVVAVAVLAPHRHEPAAPPDQRPLEVDPRGPASLDELRNWLGEEPRSAKLSAEATFAPALQRHVTVATPALGLFDPATAHPSLSAEVRSALVAMLHRAVPAPNPGAVWEHSIALQWQERRARVLLRRPEAGQIQLGLATPRGAVPCSVLPFPDGELAGRLDECTEATIAARGIVLGDRSLEQMPRSSKRLTLHGVSAAAALQLDQFPKLWQLDLCGSPAAHTPEVLSRLARLPLTSLTVCSAMLDDRAALALGELTRLTELFCVPPGGFASVLNDNESPPAPALGAMAVQRLARLVELKELALCGAVIRDADLAPLATLPKLHSLGLLGCRNLDGSGLQAFGPLLTDLDLRRVPCPDPARALASLSALRTLLVGGDQPFDLPALASLPALEQLIVDGRIDAAQLATIRTLTHLRKLGLRPSPPLGDHALVALYGATQLRTLGLCDAHVTAAGLDGLKAALPECRTTLELW